MELHRLSFSFLLLLIPFALSGQRYISGCITDAENEEPKLGIQVFFSNTNIGTTTDAAGNYRLKIPREGSYRLMVPLVGINRMPPLDYIPETNIETTTTAIEANVSIEEELAGYFEQQLNLFPQEKIYLHTDKPYYLSGERIWFRAHLADAATHYPVSYSRYVYVELINPLDTVVVRVKILQNEGGYHGHLLIPEDVPEGDYTLRAYTSYMRSQEENYFCVKPIHIGDPQARAIHTETKFMFESDRRGRIQATFKFSNIGMNTPLVPKSVKVSVNNGRMMSIKADDDGTASFSFNLPAASRQRSILLEVIAFNNPYRQFIHIPMPDDDFDVSFYPEGGSLMQGVFCKIAFKAMKSNGQATDVSGVVHDSDGAEILKFNSEHLGMGSFRLNAVKGKTYYAVCENAKGQSKRFDLPTAVSRGYSLSVNMSRNRIYLTVQEPEEAVQDDELYLLAHIRGLVYFVTPLHQEKSFSFSRHLFPSGVLHFVLFDAGLNPLSERLAFINREDQAQVSYHPDQENFVRRSLVKNKVVLTDSEGEPLSGSFSVAVTSDREVAIDSTSNILTQLLLSSDLCGNIEHPAYYFQNAPSSSLALDLLMLTQGWRRYNIADIAHGRFAQPAFPVELFSEISGSVKRVALGSPVENIEVTVISKDGDHFGSAQTNKDGRFTLRGIDLPDSTKFIIHAVRRKGMASMELSIDEETFPERTLFAVPPSEPDRNQFAKYADKAEQMYVSEGGIRVYNLSEVTITAQKKPTIESFYYDPALVTHSMSEEDIKKLPAANMLFHLAKFPGVYVNIEPPAILIRGGLLTPTIFLDDMQCTLDEVVHMAMSDVARIDLYSGANPFGMSGAGGAIAIYTKRGESTTGNTISLHIKSIMPLGYRQPVEFYAPKYDTPEKRNANDPDLRTTIHWQPVVQTDSAGTASFEFYAADEPTSYTVVMEGLTDEGKIIRQEGKLWRK